MCGTVAGCDGGGRIIFHSAAYEKEHLQVSSSKPEMLLFNFLCLCSVFFFVFWISFASKIRNNDQGVKTQISFNIFCRFDIVIQHSLQCQNCQNKNKISKQ